MNKMVRFRELKLHVQLPFIGMEGTWEPNEVQMKAAWELYIELATRISIVELKEGEGLLREVLHSLYSIFSITREILKKYGPEVAISNEKSQINLGQIAIHILNRVLRPVLAKWHPVLLDYENKRPTDKSIVEHERVWPCNEKLRIELNKVRKQLLAYADVLAEAAGIEALI